MSKVMQATDSITLAHSSRPIGAIRAESWPDPEPGKVATASNGSTKADGSTLSDALGAELRWTASLHGKRCAYRSPTLQALSFRFGVRCTDARLGSHIDSILTPLRSPVPAAHWYSLVMGSHGGIDVFHDGALVKRLPDPTSCVAWLIWDINRAAVESTAEHLLLHAGGVEARGGGIVFPGPSGSGKSTLVVSLVRAGLNYLSDEIVALRLPDLELIAYPRSMVIKPGSFAPLAEVSSVKPPVLPPLSDSAPTDAHQAKHAHQAKQWYLRPSEVRPNSVSLGGALRFVVIPRYVPAAPTALRRLSHSEGFLSLATSSVNIREHGASGVRALADIVDRCDMYELVMSDLEKARNLILDLLDG